MAPQSHNSVAPLHTHELHRSAALPAGRTALPAHELRGWMATKPLAEAEVPWAKSAVSRRYCVLEPSE
eukprot:826838-Prymnesium_polylepis.1